jgi:7-cyano-7-deazaguanine synthase
VLLSGGIDSATALYLTKKNHAIRALTFEYNGIAAQELRAARAVAKRAGVLEHRVTRLPDLKEACDIPGGRFEGLPPTYIPLRNAIFYSFAASYAEEVGAAAIVGGHNRDDRLVFEDVRSEFFRLLQRALLSGSARLRKNRLRIVRPLRRMSKVEVVRNATSMKVPLELTWSCHKDGPSHCWDCPGCEARTKSFMKAGVPDPISSSARKIS